MNTGKTSGSGETVVGLPVAAISPAARDLGVDARFLALEFAAVPVLRPEFEQVDARLLAYWVGRDLDSDARILGYRLLHNRVGRSNTRFPSSVEKLVGTLVRRGRLPRIHPLVDVYNSVSLATAVSMGAHALDALQGRITLTLTSGGTSFLALGANLAVTPAAGEYVYVDGGGRIVCRLDCMQAEHSRLRAEHRRALVIVQGNPNIDAVALDQATRVLLDDIRRYIATPVMSAWLPVTTP